ncbi:NAD(P)H-dependent oxidoreductase [Natronococcus sp. A-GB7]|uniref:NADPH-dependent FMN reductase n=1 Tax=Natronococcus sp. A-GB7 TaxID=3037649 RepID=UPI00241DEC07|nr:NAD(P)H-dependent oxidoreductase [Natronococcus sp. A-GB7]MDG5820710.1 NAD(P)H-dependent oxidoreductase [Natronococcus sp. A-GB7]
MDENTRVVAIAGSLREESYTRPALQHALDAAAAAGASTELIDLRELEIPLFDADDDEAGDTPELARRVREADAILLGTPMYHGSYSSVLKTALDYCGFDEFENKTVGLLAVSGGSFPIGALDHLRVVCRALDAWVLPHQAAVPNAHRRFEGRELVDDDIRQRVETLGTRAVQFANIEPDPESFESRENVGADERAG